MTASRLAMGPGLAATGSIVVIGSCLLRRCLLRNARNEYQTVRLVGGGQLVRAARAVRIADDRLSLRPQVFGGAAGRDGYPLHPPFRYSDPAPTNERADEYLSFEMGRRFEPSPPVVGSITDGG